MLAKKAYDPKPSQSPLPKAVKFAATAHPLILLRAEDTDHKNMTKAPCTARQAYAGPITEKTRTFLISISTSKKV
jgi:hypothetical protein